MSHDHEQPALPRDLPRSPTGRIPQWVIDERLGRAAPRPAHRAPAVAAADFTSDQVPPSRRRGAVVPLVIVVAVVLATVGGGLRSAWSGARPEAPAQGSAGASYRFLATQDDGTPVAFPSCRTIEFVVRRDGEPDGGAQVLASAIEEVSRASGLRFADVGSADAPSTDGWSAAAASPFTPVVIEWQTPSENPALAGDVAGQAGPLQVAAPGHPTVYVGGEVQLDGPQLAVLLGQRNGAEKARAIVLHELGHLVGLDHVDDPSQLMYPRAREVLGYAQGDLTGLAELGRGECASWL